MFLLILSFVLHVKDINLDFKHWDPDDNDPGCNQSLDTCRLATTTRSNVAQTLPSGKAVACVSVKASTYLHL